jgi:hypothetical protein
MVYASDYFTTIYQYLSEVVSDTFSQQRRAVHSGSVLSLIKTKQTNTHRINRFCQYSKETTHIIDQYHQTHTWQDIAFPVHLALVKNSNNQLNRTCSRCNNNPLSSEKNQHLNSYLSTSINMFTGVMGIRESFHSALSTN